jgi:hypothetical protein
VCRIRPQGYLSRKRLKSRKLAERLFAELHSDFFEESTRSLAADGYSLDRLCGVEDSTGLWEYRLRVPHLWGVRTVRHTTELGHRVAR